MNDIIESLSDTMICSSKRQLQKVSTMINFKKLWLDFHLKYAKLIFTDGPLKNLFELHHKGSNIDYHIDDFLNKLKNIQDKLLINTSLFKSSQSRVQFKLYHRESRIFMDLLGLMTSNKQSSIHYKKKIMDIDVSGMKTSHDINNDSHNNVKISLLLNMYLTSIRVSNSIIHVVHNINTGAKKKTVNLVQLLISQVVLNSLSKYFMIMELTQVLLRIINLNNLLLIF